jgi:signal transduction histidine kinase
MGRGEVEAAVDQLTGETTRRWERMISVARLLFCLLITVRQLWTLNHSSVYVEIARQWLTVPVLVLTVVFALATLLANSRRIAAERVVLYSVALDAVGAFCSLATNAVWPWDGYLGLTNMPDLSALLVVTFAAGLRLSPRAALLGGVLNCLSYAALIAIDVTVSGPPRRLASDPYGMWAIGIVGAATLAFMVARRARSLVARAAETAVAADRARRNLGTLLDQHHDVRSLMSAVQLDADRLARSLRSGEAAIDLESLADKLRDGIGGVEERMRAVRAQAHGDLLGLAERQAVDLATLSAQIVDEMRRRFPAVTLSLHADRGPRAWVAGGDAGWWRILSNLLANACEGDGSRAATRVSVQLGQVDGLVVVDIDDDGPGFSEAALAGAAGVVASSKPAGSGHGMATVAALVQASEGVLTRSNRAAGGASVRLRLLPCDLAPTSGGDLSA